MNIFALKPLERFENVQILGNERVVKFSKNSFDLIHRYVAICKPFLSHTMSKLSRAYKLILIIWLVSVCLAIPQVGYFLHFETLTRLTNSRPFQTLFTLHLKVYNEYRMCVPKEGWSNHLFVVSTLIIFVVPMTIITFLYILIGLQLRKSKVVKRGAVTGSSVRLKVSSHHFTIAKISLNLKNFFEQNENIQKDSDFFLKSYSKIIFIHLLRENIEKIPSK